MASDWGDRIAEAMTAGSPWLLPLAFAAGLCTSLNPCAYPMIGAVAGYVWAHGRQSRWRSLGVAAAFLAGLALTYTALGVGGALVGPLLGLSRAGWAWVVGGVCIAAGLIMAEILPLEFPGISLVSRYWQRLHGAPGALALGVLLGLVATPCATPALVAVVSIAAAQRVVVFAGLLLLVYALGHGIPAIVIGLAAGSLAGLERFKPHGRRLQVAGGWLIIAVGFYVIITA